MNFYYQVPIQSWMDRPLREIYDVFDRRSKELSDQKFNLYQEITEWGDALIRQIRDHVYEQRKLLDEEYRKQEQYLIEMRQQFVAASQSDEQRGDNEKFRQLLEQCKSLKFELAALEFPDRTIPFVQFISDKQPTQKKQEGRNAQITNDNKPTTAKEMNQQPSPTGQISTSPQRSIPSNDNANNTNEDTSDWVKKCPTCCMIFPSDMPSYDRNVHINAHYKDPQ